MSIQMTTPAATDLPRIATDLSGWQNDGGTGHLHPGDLGWHSLVGTERTAADLRVWSRNSTMVALGLLDKPDLLRMVMDPAAQDDDELAHRVGADVDDPAAGVLAAGEAIIEARDARSLRRSLAAQGWIVDDPWTAFQRDLSSPISRDRIERTELRVETAGHEHAAAWLAVHWSAFKGTPFCDPDAQRLLDRWSTMTGGPFAHLARPLIAFDREDNPVAVIIVWSAGPGRPGLIEPMGVHLDHRGHGYGAAVTLAGAAALQDMGSSSAVVVAENSNPGAFAAYGAAGFTAGEPVADLKRPA